MHHDYISSLVLFPFSPGVSLLLLVFICLLLFETRLHFHTPSNNCKCFSGNFQAVKPGKWTRNHACGLSILPFQSSWLGFWTRFTARALDFSPGSHFRKFSQPTPSSTRSCPPGVGQDKSCMGSKLCAALYVWNNFILSSHLNDSLTGSRIGRVEKKIRYESVRKEEIISPQNLEDFLLVCSIVERADTTLTQNPLTHVFSSLEAFRILSLSLLFWNFKMMCSIWGYFSFTVLGMWCTLLIWRPISKEICLYCTLKMSYHFLFPFYETPIVRLLDLLDYTSILAFLTDYPGKKE